MKNYSSTAVAVEAVAASTAPIWHQPCQCDVYLERDFGQQPASAYKRCWWLQFARELFAGARFLVTLCLCIGSGWRWLALCVRLLLFVLFLLPGFIKMLVYYYTSCDIRRGVQYGSKPRQNMDIYIPENAGVKHERHPVVVFVTGGAWIIGYRAWGAILARRLASKGVLVCCLDYRNFPTTAHNVIDMISDVNDGIAWVIANTPNLRGDPNNIHLVGQSAGAHLAALSLLLQSLRLSFPPHPNPPRRPTNDSPDHPDQASTTIPPAFPTAHINIPTPKLTPFPTTPPPPHPPSQPACALASTLIPWRPSALRSYIGVSGPYNLAGLRHHFHKCGLHSTIFDRIMTISGTPSLDLLSPQHLVAHLPPASIPHLPPVRLLHGTRDTSVPCRVSADFADILRKAGVPVQLTMYQGETHTTPLLENPMRGGPDPLTDDILSGVVGHTVVGNYTPLNFDCLLRIGTMFSPF